MPRLLGWREGAGTPPYSADIALEIRSIIEQFPDFFDGYPGNPTHREKLERVALALEQAERYEPDRPIRNEHRLTLSAKDSPVYASLDPDLMFVSGPAGVRPIPDQLQIERLGRLLLLLSFCGARPLTPTTIESIDIFCRNFPKALRSGLGRKIKPLERANISRYLEIQNDAAAYIKKRDWSGLSVFIRSLDDSTFHETWRNRVENLDIIIGELKAIQEERPKREARRTKTVKAAPSEDEIKARQRKKQAARVKAIVGEHSIPGLEDHPEEAPETASISTLPVDPDSDDCPPTGAIITPRPEPRTADLPESSLEKVSVRGSQLRFNSIWSGQSVEALTATEARVCMEALLGYKTNSDAHEIARVLLIVSGLTSHKVNNLLVGFGPSFPHDEPAPKLSLAIKGSDLEIEHGVLGCEEFADLPGSDALDRFVDGVSQTVKVRVNLAEITRRPEILARIKRIDSLQSPLLAEIIAGVGTLKRHLRETATDRFTMHRWRSTIVQATVQATSDLPLAQLLLCEDLGVNASAQHYIARDCEQVNQMMREIRHEIWGIELADAVSIAGTELIGAPWGGQRLDPIREVSKRLQSLATTDKIEFEGVIPVEHHNARVDWVAWLLMITTASRNHRDFGELKLDQLSLPNGLIVYADKPADPSIYRRLAAFPKFVAAEIERLLHYYIQLRDYTRRFNAAKSEYTLSLEVDKILSGKAPLLLRLSDKGRAGSDDKYPKKTIQRVPWKAREFINRYLSDDYRLNFSRTLFSSHARRHNLLNPLLIETQLGHVFGKSLFASDSVISPLEFSKALEDPLTCYLQLCGVDTTQVYLKPSYRLKGLNQVSSIDEIFEGVRETRKSDTQLIRRQRGLDSSSMEGEKARKAIAAELRNHLGLTEDAAFPKGISLSQEECIQLSKRVLTQVSGGERALVSALKQFRHRLKELKQSYNWNIEFPPPIYWHIQSPIQVTKFHLQAKDLVDKMQREIAQKFSQAPPDRLHEMTALFLVMCDYLPSFKLAWELLNAKPKPYQIDSFKCWAVDFKLNSKTEDVMARFFPKPAIAALDKTFSSTVPVPPLVEFYRNINGLLPKSVRDHRKYSRRNLEKIEKLLEISRLISCPQLIADVVSGRLLQRELPAKRAAELYSGGGSADMLEDSGKTLKRTHAERLSVRKKIGQFEEEIPLVKSRLPTTNSPGERPWRTAKKELGELLEDELHPTTELLLKWTFKLFEPTANRKTGGKLRFKTIRDYVTDTADILAATLGSTCIWDLDEEEIHDLISDYLGQPGKAREKSHEHINRFFSDMHELEDLPLLRFSGGGTTLDSIDADVITNSEHQYAIKLLDAWHSQGQLTTAEQSALKQVSAYLNTASSTGTRRSELQFSKNKDLQENTHVLAIRYNRTRSLKTSAARRLLLLEKNQLAWLNALLDVDREWLFNDINRADLRFQALSLATEALRLACGNRRARIHRYRHTVATTALLEAMREDDILHRWRRTSQLSTQLGHTTLRTTVTHYTHSAQILFALAYSGARDPITKRMLEYFQNTEDVRRIRTGVTFRTFTRRLSCGAMLPNTYTKTSIHPLPVDLSRRRRSSVHSAIDLFESMFRGKSGAKLIESVMEGEVKTRVLKALSRLQHETNFQSVPSGVLQSWIVGELIPANQLPRRNLPSYVFREWRQRIEELSDEHILSASSELMAFARGIRWCSRPVVWNCAPEDSPRVGQLIESLGLPIDAISETTAENRLILVLKRDAATPASAAITIRCLLQLALSLSAIAESRVKFTA